MITLPIIPIITLVIIWLLYGVLGAMVARNSLQKAFQNDGLPWEMTGWTLVMYRWLLAIIVIFGPAGLVVTIITDLVFYRPLS